MRVLLFILPFFLACQGPKKSPSEEPAAPETTATIAYTLAVEGMTCTGCENTVKNAIKAVEGVSTVEASFENEEVTVTVSETADTAAIRQQIITSGYTPAGSFELKNHQ